MHGIQTFSLDVGQMTCGREGEYVRVSDHRERMRVLREALDTLYARSIDRLGPHKFGCSVCRFIGRNQDDIKHRDGCVIAKARAALKETADGN